MTREDLIAKLTAYAGSDYAEEPGQDQFVYDCVDDAINEVMNEMCPWASDASTFSAMQATALARYPWNIYRIAQFHYDKQGKNGVKTFYEAGQTTTFDGGGTPRTFFQGIVPISQIT